MGLGLCSCLAWSLPLWFYEIRLVGSRCHIGKPNSAPLSACSSALLSRLEDVTFPSLPYVFSNHSSVSPGYLVALGGTLVVLMKLLIGVLSTSPWDLVEMQLPVCNDIPGALGPGVESRASSSHVEGMLAGPRDRLLYP